MLIAIGGLSRSGKTKLARQVRRLYTGKVVKILHQDDYVKAEADIPRIRDHIDWEVPASVDVPVWRAAILAAQKVADIVIVEGIFVFAFHEINLLYDRSILVEIPEKIFLERKRIDLRWGKEPEWYIQYIWEAYQEHGLPPVDLEVHRVAGNRPLDREALEGFLR